MLRHRLVLVLAVLFPVAAGATTVRLYDEPEMAKHAAAILRGRVASVVTRAGVGRIIVTDVTVDVERILKATHSQKQFTFTQMGGTLDGQRLTVPGSSTYEVGEEVLIFLEDGGAGLVELGIGAGKYRIDRSSGQPMVQRQLRGVTFARVDGKRATPAPPPRIGAPEPLEAFERRILSHIGVAR